MLFQSSSLLLPETLSPQARNTRCLLGMQEREPGGNMGSAGFPELPLARPWTPTSGFTLYEASKLVLGFPVLRC